MASLRRLIRTWGFTFFVVPSLWGFAGMIAADHFTAAESLFIAGNLVLALRIVTELDDENRAMVASVIVVLVFVVSWFEVAWVEGKRSENTKKQSELPAVVMLPMSPLPQSASLFPTPNGILPPSLPAVASPVAPKPKAQPTPKKSEPFKPSPLVIEELPKQMVRLSDDLWAFADDRQKEQDKLPPLDPNLPPPKGKTGCIDNPVACQRLQFPMGTGIKYHSSGFPARCLQIMESVPTSMSSDEDVIDLKSYCEMGSISDLKDLKYMSGLLAKLAQRIENTIAP